MTTEKSGTGLPRNTAAALSYVLGPITGIVFYILERDEYVRFHALQSTVIFTVLFMLQWFLGMAIILIPLIPLISILSFVLWLLLIYKAWQGEEWEVPVLGVLAKKVGKKINK